MNRQLPSQPSVTIRFHATRAVRAPAPREAGARCPLPVDSPETASAVRRIVRRLRRWDEDEDDLLQEALVRLWHQEALHPGHSRSWYLQNCAFHLFNLRRCGRCIDSPRHRHAAPLPLEGAIADRALTASTQGDSEVFAAVAAADLFEALTSGFDARDQDVLERLCAGFTLREIAAQCGCSHTNVIKVRRRIAARALRLGVEPPAVATHRCVLTAGGNRRAAAA